MVTAKQHRLIKLLLEHFGNPKSKRTLAEIMMEAGYSKASAKNPQLYLESEGVQDGLKEVIGQLKDKRNRAITYITESKLQKSHARDLGYLVDLFTKNIQLLEKEPTETIEHRGVEFLFPNAS